ncbi:hypothetical protein BDQ12DRAFT_739372 [Crucibulum laeve]|uniref:Uncharacterized protein n=1 Tax=Crucibulum laeve TaxID=68775 RepID=A0A5C3LJJ4_9AGAR|nr:hypothetical protein BDQ12DRAFT_739372 [Crucibulum laeve]
MRQWIAVRTISQRYQDRGRTQTHGFFIQMGGFMLYEGNSPVHILSITEFDDLVQKNQIKFPDISVKEIQDKSNGDMLSKGIVVLQTSWFIIQCIAPAFQKLALTELEVVTLSFCALNGLMYYLWWNKPLDVRCNVPVHKKTIHEKCPSNPSEHPAPRLSFSSLEHPVPRLAFPSLEDPAPRPAAPSLEDPSPAFTVLSKLRNTRKKLWDRIRWNLVHTIWILPWEIIKWAATVLLGVLVFVYIILFTALLPYYQISGFATSTNIIGPNAMKFPEFYAYKTDNHYLTHLGRTLCSVAAIGFGGIHCIAWFFHFPSLADQLKWRVSASIITGTPALVTAAVIGYGLVTPESRMKTYVEEHANDFFISIFGWLLVLVVPLALGLTIICVFIYVPARICLLVVALKCLTDLPDGAYQTVEWTRFLPHF